MNHSQREYIALCKQLIEEKFHFENDNGALRKRDLEYLADRIEEKSGIKLSLSTVKRLWKKDYDQTPHPSTLEALVSLLGYKDWQEFKLKQTFNSVASPETETKTHYRPFNRWMMLPLAATLILVFWLIAFRTRERGTAKLVIKGPVSFKGNKTVAEGVPSTIIFNYDVSNIEADSFFFQQSWNGEKVKIDPKGQYYSTIYYYPGFHSAKLIANDSIVGLFRAHITTDGWTPLISYSSKDNVPVYIKKDPPVTKGALHITRDDLVSSRADVDKGFILSYFNVREFENTNSDNFSVDTRIVCDSSAIACAGVEFAVMCEADAFFVRLMSRGCERDSGVKMGELMQDGISNDLSVFGRDLYQWQDLKIQVANKKATIYLDQQPVHTLTFKNDFGKVVGLAYHFNVTGAVDYVKLTNGENKVVHEDEFVR